LISQFDSLDQIAHCRKSNFKWNAQHQPESTKYWLHVLPFCSQDRSYQVRRYEAAKWVSTVVTTASWEAATSIGFQRLFRYIQGANDAGILYGFKMKQLQM